MLRMRLCPSDLEGSNIAIDGIEEGFLDIDGFPDTGLATWRALMEGHADIAISPNHAIWALRTAMFLGKGVEECARALGLAAPAPNFAAKDFTSNDIEARVLSDTSDTEMSDMRNLIFKYRRLPAIVCATNPCKFPDDSPSMLDSMDANVVSWDDVTTNEICAHHGITKDTLLQRMIADSGWLGIDSSSSDAAEFVSRAYTKHGTTSFKIAGAKTCAYDALARRRVSTLCIYFLPQDQVIARAAALRSCARIQSLMTLSLLGRGTSSSVAEALSALTSLTQLRVDALPSNFYLPNLRYLRLRSSPKSVTFRLPMLESLCLGKCLALVSDLEGLSEHTRIRSLALCIDRCAAHGLTHLVEGIGAFIWSSGQHKLKKIPPRCCRT